MQNKRKVGLLDVKQALYNHSFQSLFPELQTDIEKFLKDPGCPCNREIYLKFFHFPDRLKQFFPEREIENLEIQQQKLEENHWRVINCHINDLESKLRKLNKGKKQVAIARYQDQVTVIINDLDVIY